ncbi:unnamed protein product [Effrenium voratum]|uniref:Uncharacterized protein n=1 Tax=Effrenium voratum TaxID=2562239 RepID=A0AA36N9U6_9DINO|nr:unnamed protein product [Effrenium voratum]
MTRLAVCLPRQADSLEPDARHEYTMLSSTFTGTFNVQLRPLTAPFVASAHYCAGDRQRSSWVAKKARCALLGLKFGNMVEAGLAVTVQAQGRQLIEQEKRIKQLERLLEELAGKKVSSTLEAEVLTGEPNDATIVPVVSSTSKGNNNNRGRNTIMAMADSATYEFAASMWDAALLLFFQHSNPLDKLILLIGCLTNLTLQLFMLLTMYLDMLENPYTDKKVQEMIAWRVSDGHHTDRFDAISGASLASKLCSKNLWSYEQEEYDKIFDYLYKPMPGVILSSLAIVMWVLTIMVEYRRCIEQALAVAHLPSLSVNDEFVQTDEEGSMRLKGIRPVSRTLALVFLSLPRLVVLGWLAIIGCIYLAQTVNLQDIVLNAVALAFVMDVDELVADVLLTERLRSLLPKIEPLSCGKSFKTNIPVKDLVRYFITAGLITLAIVQWLVPFNSTITAAGIALCGGYQDFSFSGGAPNNVAVVIEPTSWGGDPWYDSCGSTVEDWYLQKYYGARFNSSVHGGTSQNSSYYTTLKKKHVLNFAWASMANGNYDVCSEGQVLSPQNEDGARTCITAPTALTRNLPKEVKAGSTVSVANCPRFSATVGCNYSEVELPATCIWTWAAHQCDDLPPGKVYSDACSPSTDFTKSCDTWEYVFNLAHPEYNCRARNYCTTNNLNCLALTADLEVRVSQIEKFQLPGVQSKLEESIKNALSWAWQMPVTSLELTSEAPDPAESGEGLAWIALVSKNMPHLVKPSFDFETRAGLAWEIDMHLDALTSVTIDGKPFQVTELLVKNRVWQSTADLITTTTPNLPTAQPPGSSTNPPSPR